MKNKLIRILANFFLKGLLLVAPLWFTIYVIYLAIAKVDNIVHVGIPGVGLAIVVAGITIIGYLVTTFITEPIFNYFTRLLEKFPLFKLIYGSIRDLMEAFVGEEKKFKEPVIVDMNEYGLKKIGFITQKDLSILGLTDDVAVYFPHSYNFSGNFFVVPKSRVKPLNVHPAEIMKFVVSGGVSDI